MSDRASSTVPAALGYRMPAEWHPHRSTWLAWPKDPLTWPQRVPEVQKLYLDLIVLLTAGERVELLIDDQGSEESIREALQGRGVPFQNLHFHRIPTVDSWIRDYGPNFVLRNRSDQTELAYNHWGFNAWGDKYQELKRDAAIPEKLEAVLGVPRFVAPLVLEGGSIDMNGQGTCLTTEQCLLNPNRNPAHSRADIEQSLKAFLGVQQILWLGEGIEGDDTDGHVDDVARFVAPRTIVCAREEDPRDHNFSVLEDNRRRLLAARDPQGRPFEIVFLPMPGRIEGNEGRLPASYANFYVANRRVIVPLFNQPHDRVALEVLQRLFPKREVVGLDCRDLLWGLGTIHCVTQQQPATGPV